VATGAIDPATGVPSYYEDSNGTRLELCLAPDVNCPAAPTASEFAASDGSGEGFYQQANVTMAPGLGKEIAIDMDLEAAHAGPGAGQEITFGRVQVAMTAMEPNSDYTITYPYGSGVWHTDANGDIAGNDRTVQRHQLGCVVPPACDFGIALGSEIGPFMQWDPSVSVPPADHVGDGATPHAIVGPAVTAVTVSGPGIVGSISNNQFTLMGRLASPPAPVFFAAPGSGSFGTQRVGSTTTRSIQIRNNGLAAMPAFDTVAVSGAGFATSADGCGGVALDSGASCSVDVNFTPGANGAHTGSLVLTENGTPHTIALSGSGAQSGLSASPGIMNFFSELVGTTGAERALTITNTGLLPLNVTGATISGPNAAEFAITTNTCTSVAAGANCTIGMRFFPTAGGTRNATLTLTTDAPGSPHSVPLTGSGTAIPAVGATTAGGATTAAGTTTATGTTAADATGTGAGAGAAATARPALVLKSLGLAPRIKRSKAQKSGLRLTMRLPDGTEIVKINVYRKIGKTAKLLSSGLRAPSTAGQYRVSLNQATLRRLLKKGNYEVQVTPGYSKSELGKTTKASFKVV
jgi:hypothetical protein